MKTNRFIKISQIPPHPAGAPAGVPPMPPMPPMGGGMPPMDPMGLGMPPMGATPPVQPMSSPPDRVEITAELDNLGKILYDVDIKEKIGNEVGTDVKDIAQEIWQMYGGNEFGNADEGKVGKRTEEALIGNQAKQEREATKDARWERLPEGKTITDITSLKELLKVMNGLAMGAVKESAGEEAAGAAPPGGMPPMMASSLRTVRLANVLDNLGYIYYADDIDRLIFPKK